MADLLTSREFANNIVLIVVAFITGVLSPIVASWARAKFAEKKVAEIKKLIERCCDA